MKKMVAKIVFLYTDKAVEVFPETWDMMNSFERMKKYDIAFEKIEPGDTYAVYRIMKSHWGKGYDIVTVEHDMLFTEEQFDEIIDCKLSPHGCSAYYRLWDLPDLSTVGPNEKERFLISELSHGWMEWTQFVGLGLTKIRKEIQLGKFDIPKSRMKLNEGNFVQGDTMVYRYLEDSTGFHPDFHIHDEAIHLHTKTRHL